jgi:hypothetical protein
MTRVFALAASLALTVAAVAVAGGGTASETVEIEGDSAKAKATCSADRRAVAGGFKGPEFSEALTFPKLLRRAGRRGWTAGVEVVDGSAGELTAYAYCEDEDSSLAKLRAKTKSKVIPDTGFGDPSTAVRARCPRGETPVSGGFSGQLVGTPYASASRRKGRRSWVAVFTAHDPDTKGTAQANCYDGPPLQVRSKTRTIAPPSEYMGYAVAAQCPPGSRVVSGGFKSTLALSEFGPFVYESRKTSRREWTNRFILSEFDAKFTTYAYCR